MQNNTPPITIEVAQNISNILDIVIEPNIKELNRVQPENALQRLNELLRMRELQKVKDALAFPNKKIPYLAIEVDSMLYFLCNDIDGKGLFIYRANKTILNPDDDFLKFGVLWSLEQNKLCLCEIIEHLSKNYNGV